jgi:hypothetical protein
VPKAPLEPKGPLRPDGSGEPHGRIVDAHCAGCGAVHPVSMVLDIPP